MACCVVARVCAGRPSRKSAAALPERPPVNVRSPFGRLMNAIRIASRLTSAPNFSEWRPEIHVRSLATCHTWLTRSTNGCCASPRAALPPPKNPDTAIDGRPAATGLVLAKLIPNERGLNPLVMAGLAVMRLIENRAWLITFELITKLCEMRASCNVASAR